MHRPHTSTTPRVVADSNRIAVVRDLPHGTLRVIWSQGTSPDDPARDAYLRVAAEVARLAAEVARLAAGEAVAA